MTRQFLMLDMWRYFLFLLINLHISFAEEDETGAKCQHNSDCHHIHEYCDAGYSDQCHQCEDICMIDISQFEKCADVCKNYLREKVVRRLDDIESIYTLVCVIIVITSTILVLLLVLLLLKIRGRKRTKSNNSLEDTAMQMKKLQEIEANRGTTNGHVVMHSSPKQRMNLSKGMSMQTMTTAISNVDEDDSVQPRKRQPSSSTNNGGSKRSYQSSSAFYEPPRSSIRKPSEDRVPQCQSPPDNAAYDNPVSSRSPTPTSSNHTLKGPSPSRNLPSTSTRLSPLERGPNSTRLPPIGQQPNGSARPGPYTISHSQVV